MPESRPTHEPFLGYDGLGTQGVLDWIRDADPDPKLLHSIAHYERANLDREAILRETADRLRRFGEETAT